MTVRYYFDHHIHSAIFDGLSRLGVDCLTAEQDGHGNAADEDLLRRAATLKRVLVSNDADLQRIAKEWWSKGQTFWGIFRLEQSRMTLGEAIANLHFIASASEADDWKDRVEYLPV